MHILVLNWRDPKNPKSGGAESVTMEHAKYWVKCGNKVTWFTSSFSGAEGVEKINGVSIIRKGNYLTVFFYAPLFYLFSKNKFDVVVDEIHGIPFFTPLFVRRPRVAFIHEIAKEIWDYMFPFPINIIGKIIEPFYLFLYRNEKFWVPAKSAHDELIKLGVSRKNIATIFCGINQSPLKKINENKEKYPTFIFVSRVVKMKGVEDIIEAFYIISKRMKGAKLWIVGDGGKMYLNHLKNVVDSYSLQDSVVFFGFVSERKKISLLKKAHILLHASIKEGWGLVVIEAASQSTPSVVYNVSGLRDSVKNGKTGIVLPENSPLEMAKASIDLYLDKKKYKNFQENCLRWAGFLRWDKSTQQSLNLLQSLVHEKNTK